MALYAFDIETSGSIRRKEALSPRKGARIFAFVTTDEEGSSHVVRCENEIETGKALREILQNTLICHNLHFEYKFLKWYADNGYIPQEELDNTLWHDTMIQSQLLRNLASSHALDNICFELCGMKVEEDNLVANYDDYSQVPHSIMAKYQIADGERTMMIHKTFFPDIAKDNHVMLDYNNEIELIKTTVDMENYGLMIDEEKCNSLVTWLKSEMDALREKTREYLGEYFNLGSDQQVARLLYQRCKFPQEKFTVKLNAATSKDVLLSLREKYYAEDMKDNSNYKNPILEMILKWRSYRNGITMIEKYIRLAGEDKIIHPTINTNRAQTGRESCNDPNLQNVAKEQNMMNLYPIPARKCFRARPKHVLYFVDYAGIELRLIIDRSNDDTMLGIIASGGDVHHEAMECFYSQKINPEIFPEYKIRRNSCKNGHFALAYGAGAGKVAKTIGVPLKEFMRGYNTYCAKHPKIVGLIREVAGFASRNGYVKTPFGRKLSIPLDESYIGLNYLIQGTAAGLLKRAQVRVAEYLKDKPMRMVLPIHDELVFELPRTALQCEEKYISDISKIMTSFPEIKIKLDVEWKRSTTTWAEAEAI